MEPEKTLTYKSAGVDIDAGEALVERIKEPVRRTLRPEVLGGLGGFGGLFRVPAGYAEPVLVAATDGVGTKLRLAIEFDAHDGVGIDLVAMCVNDLVVQGAEPLFFLDYYSTPRLDIAIAERVISGIAEGCRIAGAALIGGETAEHPGIQTSDEYDLAGFGVGIVEREEIIDGSSITAGDAVIGLASTGVHSNGFSLIRRILADRPGDLRLKLGDAELIDSLLTPTRIYVPALLRLFADARPRGLAHITGGGLTENIPRVLPPGHGVVLDASAWPQPPVFDWLRDAGVAPQEMHRTFNCGIGMVVVVPETRVAKTIETLSAGGETAWKIGEVVRNPAERVEIQ